ncbi:MAG: hypothetical protein H7835_19370 [Magnetococcus sp. XQGC-1]
MDFQSAYRVRCLSLDDKIGLFTGDADPRLLDTASCPVGSAYFQTDGTLWKRRGILPSDWVRLVAEDSSLFTGAVASITTNKLAGNRALLSDGSGDVAVSAVTASELGFLAGTTSAIQTQLDGKAAKEITQNSRSANYTLVLADAGKQILHPAADNNARTFTIPANSSVAFPIGTTLWFANEINTLSIAILSDTLAMAGTNKTGTRSLAANSIATALKITATKWLIFGFGLS